MSEMSEPYRAVPAVIAATDRARNGDRGRDGTAQRLAWIYFNVDLEKIPADQEAPLGYTRWARKRFPTTVSGIAEAVEDARLDGTIRHDCRKLAQWLLDGAED